MSLLCDYELLYLARFWFNQTHSFSNYNLLDIIFSKVDAVPVWCDTKFVFVSILLVW